jgi:hypothetical protein|eukprot:scaffold3053_cov204-Alexandrium_tamarense.AAC.16
MELSEPQMEGALPLLMLPFARSKLRLRLTEEDFALEWFAPLWALDLVEQRLKSLWLFPPLHFCVNDVRRGMLV